MMRVAVTQFGTTLNAQENLATCLRMINEVATCKPSLIVLPALCYASLPDTETFTRYIAEQAKNHGCYIVLNIKPQTNDLGGLACDEKLTTCSTLLFYPEGEWVYTYEQQSAAEYSGVITTPYGKLGLLALTADLTFQASRELALNDAQLLCHSMASGYLDHSDIYGPARASNNKVFLAVANKVGELVQPNTPVEPNNEVTTKTTELHDTETSLIGVGQSQIISPEGQLLAKLNHNEEGFVFADIDLNSKTTAHKCRPDGTELFQQLRPELYQQECIVVKPANHTYHNEPATANVAIFATYKENEYAIDDVCHYIENNLSDIIQLPELFFIADKSITHIAEQRAQIALLSQQFIQQVSAQLRPFQYVCTSLLIDNTHQAVIINDQGLFAAQQQLHFCKRYQWTVLGDSVNIIALPLEQGLIRVAMLTADDANIPEIVNIIALNNIHVLLVPFDIQEACEVEYSLLAKAAEHRICIIAASREKSFDINLRHEVNIEETIFSKNKSKSCKSTGFIVNQPLSTKVNLISRLAQWKPQKNSDYMHQPITKYQHGKITKAVIHPIATQCTL